MDGRSAGAVSPPLPGQGRLQRQIAGVARREVLQHRGRIGRTHELAQQLAGRRPFRDPFDALFDLSRIKNPAGDVMGPVGKDTREKQLCLQIVGSRIFQGCEVLATISDRGQPMRRRLGNRVDQRPAAGGGFGSGKDGPEAVAAIEFGQTGKGCDHFRQRQFLGRKDQSRRRQTCHGSSLESLAMRRHAGQGQHSGRNHGANRFRPLHLGSPVTLRCWRAANLRTLSESGPDRGNHLSSTDADRQRDEKIPWEGSRIVMASADSRRTWQRSAALGTKCFPTLASW